MKPATNLTVAMLLSCDSFESFYGSVLGLDRDHFLASYRNDWSWYYARGLLDNGIRPVLYIPSIQYEGLYETDTGISVRFLRLAAWYRPFAGLRRAMRATRWSLYAQERVNAAAFLSTMNAAMRTDDIHLLYIQEYWGGRFDHLVHRVHVPVTAVNQGGVSAGVVKIFKRAALTKAPAIYAQTRDECTTVARYGGRPVLQPNGGDTSFFSPPPADSPRTKNIVTVARLTDKQKRTSDLIRALKMLDAEWTLNIIGSGPDLGMLQALASELGVADRVRFHGFQNREAIRAFNQQCGVYAMPSSNEAMCLALLEAIACGAAVVASRIPTFELMIVDGVSGILFPVGDVAALAAAINTAWEKRASLGSAAVKAVNDDFNAAKLYKQLAESMRKASGCAAAVAEPERELVAV